MFAWVVWAGILLPFQDPDPEEMTRFRDVIVVRTNVKEVQTDQGEGRVLANQGGFSVVQLPSRSTKVTITSDSDKISKTDLDSIDEVDFSGGMSVLVQVVDDAVEVELEEDDEPVAILIYSEEEGGDTEFLSGSIAHLSGKTRIPLPENGVAYLITTGGIGRVLGSPAGISAPDEGWSFNTSGLQLAGVSVGTGGIFGFDLEVEEASDLNTIQSVFLGETMEASQTLHLDTENFSAFRVQFGIDFSLFRLELAGFYGRFEAEGTLRTDFELFPDQPQICSIDADGRLYGFEAGLWWPAIQWNSASMRFQIGPTGSYRWFQQEYEDFSSPDGDRGGAPEIFNFTSDLEGEEDRFMIWSAGVQSSLHWTLSSSIKLGVEARPRYTFGDFTGFGLDGGLSLDIRF